MDTRIEFGIDENRQYDVFVNHLMHVFHLNRKEATTTACSILIREIIMASELVEAVV